jgi:HlyD family secretion protein/macrolide-specific efflux system membrane fusion protein
LEIAPAWAVPGRDADTEMPDDLAAAMAAVEHPPEIAVESYRDEEFVGVIQKIYPEPKSLSGVVTYLVDVVVTSENRDLLQSGMRADVRFTSEHVSNVVLCPNEAIKEGPDGKFGVYIPKPGSSPQERKTEFLPCRFGLDNGAYSEVIEGLSEGMTVYTKLPQQTEERGRG